MDASKRYRREEPKTLLQKAEEEMIYELLVAGAFALATLRRCVYIAKFYFHFLSTLLTICLFFFVPFKRNIFSFRDRVATTKLSLVRHEKEE